MFKKKKILMVIAMLLIAALLGGLLLWFTGPQRTLEKFIQAIESQDYDAAMTYVSGNISTERKDNIDWFLEDWTTSADTSSIIVTDESWRSRKIMTTDDQGNETVALNKHGNEASEKKPTPKYWAHHYQAYVNVEFDEYEDPVIIKLKRNTENSWSVFSQLFRGWQITRIKYQPLNEEDYALDDEDFEFDFEDEDFEFEVDEDGNLVPVEVDAGLEDDDEGEAVEGSEGTAETDDESVSNESEVIE